jgi:imidazolonepropionase-like amidohydrolase
MRRLTTHTLFGLACCGQILSAQADTLIRNANVHTMLEQQPRQQTDVLIRDGRIAAIGNDLSADAGTEVINANGKHLTPGLFAGITQLGLVEVSAEEDTSDAAFTSNNMRPEFSILPAYNPASSLIGIARAEGLTWTLLGADSSGGEDAGMGGLIAGQGFSIHLSSTMQLPQPGPAVLFVSLGSNAAALTGNSRAVQYMLLDQAIREAQSSRKQLADEARLLTTTGREVLTKFIADGRWMLQVDRASDILQALAWAERHELNIMVYGGAEAWRVAQPLAAAEVPVILDPLTNLPDDFDQLGARLDNAALLHQAGVQIAFSAAGMSSHNARKVRQLAGTATAHGLPWQQALLALTRNPSQMLGFQQQPGTLSEGGAATMVLWHGDPLDVTGYAEQVWINGELDETPSRQEQLLQRYLPQDPQRARQYLH